MLQKDDHNFLGGLNQDDTPKVIPPGDYTEMFNFRTGSSSEDQQSGQAETMQGEFAVPLNVVANITYYGLAIGGSFLYKGVVDSRNTTVVLNELCVDPETRNIYAFFLDTNPAVGSSWILEMNIDTQVITVVYYDKYNAICFDANHRIYDARVVFGKLVWTDNLNPIYQMDIARAKKSFYYQIGYGHYSSTTEWSSLLKYDIGQIVSNGNYYYKSKIYNNSGNEPRLDKGIHWTQLCLIEDAYYSMNVKNFYFEPIPPKHAPVVTYKSDPTRYINNLRQTLFQFAYRYVYMDWRRSTFSPASTLALPQGETETATGLANEQAGLNNFLNIEYNTGGEEVRQIEIVVRSSQDPSKWFLIETVDLLSAQSRSGESSFMVTVSLIGLGLSLPSPTVVNQYILADDLNMNWAATDYGISSGIDTTIAIHGGTTGTLTSRPDWIEVFETVHNTEISVGGGITNNQNVGITTRSANTGSQRSGSVVFTDAHSNTTTIIVTQLAGNTPPTISVLINPLEENGMTLDNTSGDVTAGSPTIDITFTPIHPAYGYNVGITIYYSIVKNGVGNGDGNISVQNKRANTKTLTMNNNANSGDTVIVYLISSVIIE